MDESNDSTRSGGDDRTRPRSDDPCESCPCADSAAALRSDGGAESPAAEDDGLDRRDVAKILATIGGLSAVGSLAAPLAGLTRVFEREYTGPIYSDGVPLVDADGDRIDENALGMGDFITVFPEPRPGLEDAPTLLVRYPEEEYAEPTQLAFTVSGYAAYSKVCTHAGCMVSDRDGQTMVCPCHFGKFNPVEGASVVGGPPPRPLPQLPITLSSDGYLIATGDFEGPVGVTE
ncbi:MULTISPECIES: ubiquinol-cytochrome c reductase iron-sulfur subunit [Halorussus]|uniref:QcrA and Rieske domain-containing protein n=1 Tax=Halorussus TaxID=1070314 RepID=UPI000E219253|nr:MULTISPECIES: Rieske 2Fe-2S domain-containing protein [Halorussus]NHN61599.1 Rieske 2Fe-2S domain-containing protein [Halorussus sp. JP-T4]